MKLYTEINSETLEDLIGLHTGLYHPLEGFMTSLDYENVVGNMRLSDNSVWTLPVTLDVSHGVFRKAIDSERLYLKHKGMDVGFVEIHDCYRINIKNDVKKVFKTGDLNHPGVKKEMSRSPYRIGGKSRVTNRSVLKGALDPVETRKIFNKKGWATVVGFQTRNPVHSAHEYLQRVGLNFCDGLFINPSVGWKKEGDFTEDAIMSAYRCMIDEFYPANRVHIAPLRTCFRYAGPREAIFHAIIRKNLGCTHFIIGRDHAGVGNYYGIYEAHELAKKITGKDDLGITLLLLKEPYFCRRCMQIVTDKHCKHGEKDIEHISGSNIRAMLKNGKMPDERFMRPEVARSITALGDKAFVRSQGV